MRRTVIVLAVSTVLLWGSAAMGSRPRTTRLDGDPDEYQAKAVHDETRLGNWGLLRPSGGQSKTSRVACDPGLSGSGEGTAREYRVWISGAWISGSWMVRVPRCQDLERLLREVLLPQEKQRYSGEGR